jgi:hypothetical protein
MARALSIICSIVMLSGASVPRAAGQTGAAPPPVIDMHVHSASTSPQEQLDRMKALNIRHVWVAAQAPDLAGWTSTIPAGQFLPSLSLPCPGGRAALNPRRCWDASTDFPDITWLRAEVQAGRIKALGELVPQLMGIGPNDARLAPYWELAETSDIPVAIHMGPGPPAAAYESSPSPFKLPEFRMAANNPLLLEEVLLRHKKLRVVLSHAGWPFLDSTIALLYAHPNVYVDVGALQAEFMVPRASYYRHLRGLVEAGFGRRIMFGSDFPNTAAAGISAIRAADFLSEDQKTDILCRNAARFLRLGEAICAP